MVANTGAAWAEQHALLLERSSKALFLIDPAAVVAARLPACARPVCAVRHRDRPFPVRRQPMLQERPVHVHRRVMLARGAHVFELKDGGGEVEELLGAGLPFDLLASRNDLCASLERVLSGVLPGDRRASAPPEEGASGPGFRLPVGKSRAVAGREAPCL